MRVKWGSVTQRSRRVKKKTEEQEEESFAVLLMLSCPGRVRTRDPPHLGPTRHQPCVRFSVLIRGVGAWCAGVWLPVVTAGTHCEVSWGKGEVTSWVNPLPEKDEEEEYTITTAHVTVENPLLPVDHLQERA